MLNKSIQIGTLALSLTTVFTAANANDAEMAEMQKQLNKSVMEKPFMFNNEQDVERYIKLKLKSGHAPNVRPGRHWRQGYTCADLRAHSLSEYAHCLAYYRYHGRYW